MKFDPRIHHRRSIRLPGYDYSQPGAYFMTIVTQGRAALFGDVCNGAMQLSQMGQIAGKWWRLIPDHFPNVELGAFVVMPNHVHGIVILREYLGRGEVSTPPVSTPPVSTPVIPTPQGDETSPLRGRTIGDETSPIRGPTLGQVVAYYKYQTAQQINMMSGSPGGRVWQRNYYEHIIRTDEEYQRIHLYIESNIDNWATDNQNPLRST